MGNLEAANDFLESAAVEIQGEPLNSTVRARFCRTGAALRADQGRLDEALALLSRASSIYENHGAFEALTQTYLAEGLLFIEELEFEQAFRALRSALTLADSTAQPQLTLAILQALALTCADLGRGESLAEVVEALDALGPLLPQPLGALRIAWTKAEVDWRLDGTSTAIPRLRKIFSTLLKEAPAVEAATAALELARMQLHDPPSLANLQTLLFSLKPLALEGKLPPPLWATLSFALGFVQLGEGYAGEVLDAAIRYLKRAQFNPELPFHPLDQPEELLSWNEVPEDLRTATAQAAGVELEDGEPESLQDRDLLAWTHEALHGVRVQFPDLGS
jgi:tetratricopeptide (TPR) repeat protein